MKNHMNFGECLKFLLNTLNISMSRLSKQINVDSSLVCRWVNGTRIPQYGTNYIENIAEFLSKNINNSYQEEGIKKIYESFYGDQEGTMNSMILRLLKESQGYSVENLKSRNSKKIAFPVVESNTVNSNIPVEEPQLSKEDLLMGSISLSSQDRIVLGYDQILNAIHNLMGSATGYRKQKKEERIIYITYNSLKFNYCTNEWLDTLSQYLLAAIEQKWTVIFLLKISVDMESIVSFIHFIVPFLKTGKIKAYYFRNYEPVPFERELYVIPKIGALSTLSTEKESTNNYGFYLRSKPAVQIFTDYINKMVSSQMVELLQYYPNDIYNQFLNSYHSSLNQNGNIYNYNCNYNLILFSEDLYLRFLNRTDLNDQEKKHCIAYHKAHHTMHQQVLQLYNIYEIYYSDSVDILIRDCIFKLFTPYGVKIIDIDLRDIIDYLQSMIEHLVAMDHYHVAIIYNNVSSVSNISFSIKEKHSLYVHRIDYDYIRYTCDEPMTVQGMESYYVNLWNQIAPINKDKNDLIQWLNRYIEGLKKVIDE